jgi:hypothetical protein
MARLRLVDGIRLEHPHTLRPGVRDPGPEHPLSRTLAARAPVDVEADDGPHGPIVDGLHHGRPPQFPVLLAWAERQPGDGAPSLVADQPGHHAAIDQTLHCRAVLLPLSAAPTDVPVIHAPAAANDRPARAVEELGQVGPAIARQRLHVESH